MTLKDQIIQDIFEGHHRGFLSGEPGRPADVARHMEGFIQLDGISEEERLLLLSILPRNAEQLWVSRLDKGLSGSNVFSVRYSDGSGGHSKPFVVKIGALSKSDAESAATLRFAAPYLHGVEMPIVRRGERFGLIGQELRNLTRHASPESLRMFLRNSDFGVEVVRRLLEERLDPWYSRSGAVESLSVAGLMSDYLTKGPPDVNSVLPEGWQDLTTWVRQIAGCGWEQTADVTVDVLAGTVATPVCIIHGDLHSQNVLVDPVSHECWPIDFAWCRESSPLLDLAMLECSLKFLAFPRRSDLRALLEIEARLASEPFPSLISSNIPYFPEISRIFSAILVLRSYVLDNLRIPFTELRKMLLVMTYSLSRHELLNLPLVIGSLQILAGAVA
ncbi:MAG TPA: phosphotransferase [Streptosporangiaceae bacterium]|nr:phosphotransferase [Streptosporangiaceae bacterium]